MKLRFDQNLSPQLAKSLGDLYPESVHVRDVGLHSAADEAVWNYAAKHGLTIISKDSDFRGYRGALETFDRNTEASFLILD